VDAAREIAVACHLNSAACRLKDGAHGAAEEAAQHCNMALHLGFSVLQFVAACCSVAQWGAVGCSGMQWGAVGCSGVQWGAVGCGWLQCAPA